MSMGYAPRKIQIEDLDENIETTYIRTNHFQAVGNIRLFQETERSLQSLTKRINITNRGALFFRPVFSSFFENLEIKAKTSLFTKDK